MVDFGGAGGRLSGCCVVKGWMVEREKEVGRRWGEVSKGGLLYGSMAGQHVILCKWKGQRYLDHQTSSECPVRSWNSKTPPFSMEDWVEAEYKM